MIRKLIAISIFFQVLGCGQTEKTLTLSRPLAGERQQITAIIRQIAAGPWQLEEDGKLAVRGTPEQVRLAEWLKEALDREPQPRAAVNLATSEFRLVDAGSNGDNLVRITDLSWTRTEQDLAEATTVIRATLDIPNTAVYTPLKLVVFRGPAARLEVADWLVRQMHPSAATPEALMKPIIRSWPALGEDPVVMIARLNPTASLQDLAETATVVRSISDARRVFTFNGGRTIVARSNAERIALGEWLVAQLKQSNVPRVSTYTGSPLPGSSAAEANANRVSIFSGVPADQLVPVSIHVRDVTKAPRIFVHQITSRIIFRGTPAQAAEADRLIKERGF